jgi:DNA polymerase-3 subunit gamma/tau
MTTNLARKWRSKQFIEIVGQPLAVRLLQNSLYRDVLFPVYLLSGTRGTGKTSTARIYAAALNCRKLPEFQVDPQSHALPCLSCDSCRAMQAMAHPDVIEIDAASHTGVDNVRQIIETASFVPVLGGKKVYIIDEAHMLSKAAFNAFLKILEEPPQTVVFIMVTTDPHKIIPTVLSRCFQVFFDPIKQADVVSHLRFICTEEGIAADSEALLLIAQETEGCMRDALNLLERLRALPELSTSSHASSITKEMVLAVLGSVDDERIVQLLQAIISADPAQLLATWQRLEMHRFSPSSVWEKLVETIRRSIWLKHAVAPDEVPAQEALQHLVQTASYEQLISMLEICYAHELSFAKTTAPKTLLELILLKMIAPRKNSSLSVSPAQKERPVASPPTPPQPPLVKTVVQDVQVQNTSTKEQEKSAAQEATSSPEQPTQERTGDSTWSVCLGELERMQDPLVASIFKQCITQLYVDQEKVLVLTFSQDLLFFKDWLQTTQKIWKPIIQKFYGDAVELQPEFTGVSTKQRPLITGTIRPTKPVVQPTQSPTAEKAGAPTKASEKVVPVAKKAAHQQDAASVVSLEDSTIGSLVAQAFPGRLFHDTSQESI